MGFASALVVHFVCFRERERERERERIKGGFIDVIIQVYLGLVHIAAVAGVIVLFFTEFWNPKNRVGLMLLCVISIVSLFKVLADLAFLLCF